MSLLFVFCVFVFFKQKTAYEMRISDWSSDVCSSDLTAVVEREHLGGICLNWGCIPTKALLRSAEVKHLMEHADAFGLSVKDISFDLAKVVKRSRTVAGQLSAGVKHLLRKNKVAVFAGQGKLAGKGKHAVLKEGTPTADLTAHHNIPDPGA